MSENHAVVFWNLALSDIGGARTPGSVQVLNVDPESVPGLSAYFDGGFTVTSHTLTPITIDGRDSLMLSLYLQRTVQVPASPEDR